MGDLKRICKDACRVASAVQETCSLEMLGGPGADFLREVVFGASDLQVEDDFPRLGGTIYFLSSTAWKTGISTILCDTLIK